MCIVWFDVVIDVMLADSTEKQAAHVRNKRTTVYYWHLYLFAIEYLISNQKFWSWWEAGAHEVWSILKNLLIYEWRFFSYAAEKN